MAAAACDWSATFDAMADGVSVHGPDYTILAVNQSLCRMLGKSKEELIGRKCYQVFHGASAPVPACPIERSRQTSCREEMECFEPTLNRWLAVSVSPILDEAGRLVRLVHTVRDVTGATRRGGPAGERRGATGCWSRPCRNWPGGPALTASRLAATSAGAIQGQPPAQVRAHGWLAAVHPNDLFRVAEQALHAANTKAPYEVEYRLGADGRQLPLASGAGGAGAGPRRPAGLLDRLRPDIEDLKQAQEILRRAHNEQLQRHRTELAHVARLSTLGETVATLVHELNQPLHAVASSAHGSVRRLLSRAEKDEDLLAALEQIVGEADRRQNLRRSGDSFRNVSRIFPSCP